jgi:hypothetical protein
MGIFSFVKPGKKIFKTITSVKPKVNKNKLDKAKSNLAIATQKRKGAEAKLAQTLFEGKNKSFKKQDDFTFATTKRKTPKVSEQKAKGGRVGLKKGSKFPDLTGDGKVTFADILKGRGVINGKKKKKVI